MAHLDHYPHVITQSGEHTIHEAVMNQESVTAIKEIDGEIHLPTDADWQLIEAEKSACG